MSRNLIISPKTDINKRSENQDVFGHYDTPFGSLLIVCDGMGGSQAGHAAADYTTSNLPILLRQFHARNVPVEEALHQAVASINQRVYALGTSGDPQYQGMGSTLVFALDSPTGLRIGHVGDSRAYLFRESVLSALTQDHAPVAALLAQGQISPQEARNHPKRSLLSLAIGAQPDSPLELMPAPLLLLPGDSILLCSDGLTGFVEDKAIADTLKNLDDLRGSGDALVQLAKTSGSDDNITVLLAYLPLGTTPLEVSRLSPLADSEPSTPNLTARALLRPPPTRPKPSFLSQKQALPPTIVVNSRSSWLTLILLFVLGCLATLLHFHSIFEYTPRGSEAAVTMVADDGSDVVQITEIESLSEYDWFLEDCPTSMAEQAKSMLGQFELELRKSMSFSAAEEMRLGVQYANEFELQYPGLIDTDPVWTDYINQVGRAFLPYLNRQEISYQFHYVDHELENAFSLPGGHIYIFRGLLEERIHSEAQLAFVLAHELKHVDNRHALAFEQILKRLPAEVRDNAGGAVTYFVNQPFSMNREEEADFEALKLMLEEGYSPCQAVLFLEGMVKEEPSDPDFSGDLLGRLAQEFTDLLSSHPNLNRRQCQVRNQVIHLLRRTESDTQYVGTSNFVNRIPQAQEKY